MSQGSTAGGIDRSGDIQTESNEWQTNPLTAFERDILWQIGTLTRDPGQIAYTHVIRGGLEWRTGRHIDGQRFHRAINDLQQRGLITTAAPDETRACEQAEVILTDDGSSRLLNRLEWEAQQLGLTLEMPDADSGIGDEAVAGDSGTEGSD